MLFRRKNKQSTSSGRRQIVRGERPTAFSYYANRTEQDFNLGRLQPREQDSRRRERLIRFWRQRLGMLLAGMVLIVCVLDVLHLSPDVTVVSLDQSSSSTFLQPTATYQRAAQKLLAGSILNGNKITVNSQAIQAKLKRQFPELADVSMTLPLMGHRPIIYIASSTPGLLLKTNTGDFILNTSGRALLPADKLDAAATAKLPVVTDQSGLHVTTGSVALPSASVSFIQTVTRELQAKGVNIESLTLPTAAYELDVKPTGENYYVKFNLHDTASVMQQAGAYLAVRDRLTQQNIKPSSYIDVRLNGRAYYK